MRFSRAITAVASLLVSAALAPPPAQAATVTVGSPLAKPMSASSMFGSAATVANLALEAPGAHATSPVNGVIVRWRLAEQFEGGSFSLRVLRPTGKGTYIGAGTSPPETPSLTQVQTFTTDLPIQAGDLIALNGRKGARFATSAAPHSSTGYWIPAIGEGATSTVPVQAEGEEYGFNADVQPPPGIESMLPAAGSISGGLRVGISGHDFSGASAVNFGSTPASSFSVDADGQITATTPPRGSPGTVDVSVTTVAGTTPPVAADKFTYIACVVPKLLGRSLKVSRKMLKRAGCVMGKVRGARSRTARVRKQSPRPGTVLVPAGKVNVRIGYSPRRTHR
jgi:hypothetical protein